MSREDFEGIAKWAKENHKKRVEKNPERIKYAIKMYIPEFIAGFLTCIGIELIALLVWAWVLYRRKK